MRGCSTQLGPVVLSRMRLLRATLAKMCSLGPAQEEALAAVAFPQLC